MRRGTRYAIPVAALAAATTGGACTSVVWYGHSPDRRHRVQVLERGKKQRVERDGAAGRSYRGVGLDALVFSPDSRRLAYPAQRKNGAWVVVVDGEEGAPWDGIGALVFSPDSRHLAYLAQRGERWHVVRDGAPGPALEGMQRGSLRFSPDSRSLLLVSLGEGQARVVQDGRRGPPCRRIGRLLPGPSGRLAYVCAGPSGQRVVNGDEPGPVFDEIGELVASADGSQIAYSARRGQRWQVLLNGRAVAGDQAVQPSGLRFTSDGRLLYVAGRGRGELVVFGGREGPTFDEVQLPVTGPGGRWGHIGRRGDRYFVVLDGVEKPIPAAATGLVLGPGAGRHAYLVRRGPQVEVVHDRGRHRFDLVLPNTLVFSADGRELGFLAGDRSRRELFLAIGDRRGVTFDLEELNAALMVRPNPTQAWLRGWVQAELARALQNRRENRRGSHAAR
jgi:hypothetical protein